MKTHLTTLTGRVIPAPKQKSSKPDDSARTIAGIVWANTHIVNTWLVEQAIAEAEAKNDDFNGFQFKRLNSDKLTQSDLDTLNDYLFGQESISLA